MSVKARIWWDPAIQAYRFQGPFKKELLDFLKSHIPSSDRTYDDVSKIWTFTENHLDGVKKLAMLVFGTNGVAILDKASVEAASQSRPSSNTLTVAQHNSLDKACIDFMKTITFEAAQSAYRKASMRLHPDHGGDMESMTKLNSAWMVIEKELFKNG